MTYSPYITHIAGLLLLIVAQSVTGFYIQPDVLFFSEQPSSQKVVANSDFSLSCSVQLRGLTQEEGGLNVPVVQWRFNNIYNVSDVFPEAVTSQNLTTSHLLHSTLHISHSSHNHTGTYHCNVIDGTNEGEMTRDPDLCLKHPCLPFITASNPATVIVIENNTAVEVVEVHTCSSAILQCGTLLSSTPGLIPVLEWDWNGTELSNGLSNNYHILSTGDLTVFHSTEVGIAGVYRCMAKSGSHSTTVATYTVVEAGHPGTVALQLATSPSSQVPEGNTFSVFLASSGICSGNVTQSYVWTRDIDPLCSPGESSGDRDEDVEPQSDTRYKCEGRVLTVSSASALLDTGRYCCDIASNGAGIEASVCVDVQVILGGPPPLSSPHNSTTLTVNTSLPAQLTLTCTASQPNTSHYWLYNSQKLTTMSETTDAHFSGSGASAEYESLKVEENGSLVISVENSLDAVGIYQCFVGNDFGYSAATLRILPEGLSNPPGSLHLREIPRPNRYHHAAYLISWLPPSYPTDLHNVEYSLSTLPSTMTRETSVEVFISLYTFISLFTTVVDAENGRQLSERSPSLKRYFQDAECIRYVLHPPELVANCSVGVAGVSWTNNPLNYQHYNSDLYGGPEPGLYYINIACSFMNDSVFETESSYTAEGQVTIEEDLPLGVTCVFEGAATPNSGPDLCLDPEAVLYSSNTCLMTKVYVEFENSSYVATEGDGLLQVCFAMRGYNSFQLTATYDDNTTEVIDVSVSAADVPVCVGVEIRDDNAVNAERSVLLRLRANNSGVITGPPAVITVYDNDELQLYFTAGSYEVEEGNSIEVCVGTDADLRRPVDLYLSSEDSTATERVDYERLDNHQLTIVNGPDGIIEPCVTFYTFENTAVEDIQTFDVILKSSDHAVVIPATRASVTIRDNDKLQLYFTAGSYEVEEGNSIEVCVGTDGEDLRRPVDLYLSSEDSTATEKVDYEQLDNHQLTIVNGPDGIIEPCVTLNTSENTAVEDIQTFDVILKSSDHAVVIPATRASVTIRDNDKVRVGFTESQLTVMAGQMQNVCMLVDGQLRRNLIISLSISEENLDLENIADLHGEQIVFNASNQIVCVLLNTFAVHTEVIISLSLEKEPGEEAVIWTNQKNLSVTIRQEKSDNSLHKNHVVVTTVVVLLVTIALVCLVSLLALHYLRKKNDVEVLKNASENLFHETDGVRNIDLSPTSWDCASIKTEYETPNHSETGHRAEALADSGLGGGVSDMGPLQLPPARVVEQEEEITREKPTLESKSLPSERDDTRSSIHSSTSSNSHRNYIDSEMYNCASSYPRAGTDHVRSVPVSSDVEDSASMCSRGESSGISSASEQPATEPATVDCLDSPVKKHSHGEMDLSHDDELVSFFNKSLLAKDSGLGNDNYY